MRPGSAALLALAVLAPSCDRTRAARKTPASTEDSAAPAGSPAAATDARAAATASIHCKMDPSFPSVLDVPEGSAAAEIELRPGARDLFVVSDSDRKGAALAYALPDGPPRPMTLPIDPRVSDDTEGLAWLSGHLYALVSIGYIERFTPDGHGGLTRDADAYVVGPPPFVASWTTASNQPPDFEGLCLRSPPSPVDRAATRQGSSDAGARRCDGYAASRAYGWLVCLVFDAAGRLRVNPDHPRLALDVPKQSLSDCAFGSADGPAKGDLLVTTNIRGGSTVYEVDETTGALAAIDVEGTINNEAIAVDRDGRLYEIADQNAGRSPAARASCTGW